MDRATCQIGTHSATVAGLLAAAGFLPTPAQAAWPQAAFEAKTMADAVNDALIDVVSKAAKIDVEKAKVVIDRMKAEGRYAQDIFGQ